MAVSKGRTGTIDLMAGKDIFRIFCLLSVLLFASFPAWADPPVTQLTEGNITEFINRTSDMTNQKSKELGGVDAKAYFEKHLHPNARFKSKMSYVIPGFPSKEAELALNKEEFIGSLASGSQNVDNYSNKITIKSIKIASSGKTATVDSEGTEEGMMDVQGEPIPMMGISQCNQILMLSSDGVIQMFNANCQTEIRFKE